MKYYLTLVLSLGMLFSVSAFAGTSPINLRLNVAQYDAASHKMLVDVQLEYDQAGQINLASQNYRFFYDSDALVLDTKASKNLLGSDYGDLKWETTQSGMDASDVKQLAFDNDLGFANFSIALIDNRDGGKTFTSDQGWVTIAQLSFDVKEDANLYSVVWGRQDVTDLYATAFVEIGEWKSSTDVELLDVQFFGDLKVEKEELASLANLQYKIGPNPTSDFIQLQLGTSLTSDAKIIVQNIQGQTFINRTMAAGETSERIDLSDLASSTYILRVFDDNKSLLETTIAVAR